ncbi:MAG: hypothetical protein ACT6S0_06820 [Roseateles sp.]
MHTVHLGPVEERQQALFVGEDKRDVWRQEQAAPGSAVAQDDHLPHGLQSFKLVLWAAVAKGVSTRR